MMDQDQQQGGAGSDLAEQLDRLWARNRSTKFRRLDVMDQEVMNKVDDNLKSVQRRVNETLEHEKEARRKTLADIRIQTGDFLNMSQLWHQRSQMNLKRLEEMQNQIQDNIDASHRRLSQRKEAMMDGHHQRNDELTEKCAAVIHDCHRRLDA